VSSIVHMCLIPSGCRLAATAEGSGVCILDVFWASYDCSCEMEGIAFIEAHYVWSSSVEGFVKGARLGIVV
jgi:hypothetical protein